MFDNVLEEASQNLQDSDLGRVIIHHDNLSNPIYVPLRPLRDLNGEYVMEHLQNVLNSHQDMPINQSFRLDVGTMELPKGGRPLKINSLTGPQSSVTKKQSIIEIKNNDNLCLARAIAMCFVRLCKVSTPTWKETIKNDTSQSSIEELIIKHQQCPSWYYIKMSRSGSTKQTLFANTLCIKAGVPHNRILTLCDISAFEELLNVDILVVAARMGNRFLKIPSQGSKRKRLYLYLVGPTEKGHFHAIVKISGFFGDAKYCESCLVPYQKRHQCVNTCDVCHRKTCIEQEVQISCIKCHRTCRSIECFNEHKTPRVRKFSDNPKSDCELYWRCTQCKRLVETRKRNPEEHECGEWQCQCCKEYVHVGHLCYVRALEPKKSSSKFIFFDFECSQEDDVIQCEDHHAAERNPECPVCKDMQIPCKECVKCIHCRQSWCGKFRHTPNLVIAHTVCELCKDEALEFKCEQCGYRCSRCQENNSLCDTCGGRETVFVGENSASDFGKWLFNESHKDVVVFAHNMKGYDGYFLLDYLIENSIVPDNIIYAGSKIMYMHVSRGLNIRVLDSLNFLPMKLAQLPGAFNLKELHKGYFPHYFNKAENQTYIGPYPAPHYYGCDYMSDGERDEFMRWYQGKTDTLFDFKKEIMTYCRSDVDILRQACMKFRNLLIDITGTIDKNLTEDGEIREDLVGSMDPFNEVTIAGVCAKVFRTKFLTEKWKVKLRKDDEVSKWLNATLQEGKMTVELEGVSIDGNRLQDLDYIIEESRFVSSPLAQVPSQGYVARDQFSEISIKWLEWVMEESGRRGAPLYIRHALNGGEVVLPGTRYRLDGYESPSEKYPSGIAYEFHGCYWHGCRECYPLKRKSTKTVRTGQSMDELWYLTQEKKRYIKSLGIKYVAIWEHEFAAMLSANSEVERYVANLDVQTRLQPRESFYGGRTNAIKLQYSVAEGEKIHYADFTSLYPYVNKYAKYPVGHPEIITKDFNSMEYYFGIAKIKVLPPRGLYHPVLPQRIDGKLTFSLCRTCAENSNQHKCDHDDDNRAFVGTWCTPEIMKAIERGYKIIKIYEVYHWDETSQYDSLKNEGGIFGEYINMFLKIKQEASGWPSWVKTEDDVVRYIEDYHRHEGILLKKDNIKKNKALRSLAKLLLNSFWGKFGQRLNMPQTSFFHDSETDKFFQCLSDPRKNVKDFHIISDDIIQLTWENGNDTVPENMQTNVFIASFTTTYARLRLYTECLEKLEDRVLYMDTDSVIYVQRRDDQPLPLGDLLGELTSELDEDDYIEEFVSGGPKQYAYKTVKGKRECKIRGFSLNYTNKKLLNFDSLQELLVSPNSGEGRGKKREHECDVESNVQTKKKKKKEKTVPLTNRRKITRHKLKRKIYNREEEKHYKVVYTKRVLQEGTFDTLPYGY
ncbi:uncharacterized protein [Argopecten irradians]|uniref:uncharacterized protein n=1 Tax=Argopecten irradians TaxID=31199 RepID=UPI00371CFBD3